MITSSSPTFVVWEVAVLAFEEEVPEIYIRDAEFGIVGLGGHVDDLKVYVYM